MNRERLMHLRKILEAVPPFKFAMDNWFCGSAACALGHACLDPEFQAQGLRIGGQVSDYDGAHSFPEYQNYRRLDAGAVFFDLSYFDARWLFIPSAYLSEPVLSDHVIAKVDHLLANDQMSAMADRGTAIARLV